MGTAVGECGSERTAEPEQRTSGGVTSPASTKAGGERDDDATVAGETAPAPDNVDIATSLEGIELLPSRIRWTVTPGPSLRHVQMVEFSIDGRLWWIDGTAPYSYGPGGAELVTTWLDPNTPHRFTVGVLIGPERQESKTVTAGVPATARQTLDIATSLDELEVLPKRVRWTVTPGVAAEQVQEVQFLIDDKPAWIDRDPPFAYGPDGAYLATAWLYPPRRHRFTVRVIETDGSTTTKSVVARVRKVPDTGGSGLFAKLPPARPSTHRRPVSSSTATPP